MIRESIHIDENIFFFMVRESISIGLKPSETHLFFNKSCKSWTFDGNITLEILDAFFDPKNCFSTPEGRKIDFRRFSGLKMNLEKFRKNSKFDGVGGTGRKAFTIEYQTFLLMM